MSPPKIAQPRWRQWLGVKLGVLCQYEPRAITYTAAVEVDTHDLPTISIVTPSYNQGVYIGSTVQSVIDQQYPRLQYVIQDAGSIDCTGSILNTFPPGVFELAIEPDEGQADALNRGFAKCHGDILGYLNSDDLLLDNALKTVGAFFRDNPQVDVVYGNRLIIDADGHDIGRWILPGHDGMLLRWIDYIPQETLFWRRRAWERVGGYMDVGLDFALDWDLLLRFEESGVVFAHLPQLLGAFRVHSLQKTTMQYALAGRKEIATIRKQYRKGISILKLTIRHFLFLIKHLLVDKRFGD